MKKYLLLLVSASYFLFPAVAQADWFLDRSGTLVQIDGTILGDDDSSRDVEDEQEVENEVEDESDDSGDDSSKRAEEAKLEALKKQTETRLKNQEKNPRESNLEIRQEGGKTKLKQEIRDKTGRVVSKREVEMKEGETLHVEQEDGEIIEVEAHKDGRLEMVKNKVRTTSDLEIKVNEKNEITVLLPNGKTKEVSLPDKALERLVANGVIAAQLEGEENQYELIAGKNGNPAYEVEGTVEKKVFGLFKLKFAQKLEVAAADSDEGDVVAGDVVDTESLETSPWRRFLERFSI